MSEPWIPEARSSHAVLIGASVFESTELNPIPSVKNNLDSLRQALTHPVHGVVDPKNCVVLSEPDDERSVGDAILAASRAAEDALIIYYAGHGILDDDGILHLAIGHTNPDRVGYSALSLSQLKRDFARARARGRVLLLDCCFSGQAIEAMGAPRSLVSSQLMLKGTYTLTSTSATTPAHAPRDSPYTAFTGALLSALAQPGPLTLDQIYQRIKDDLEGQGLPEPQRRATDGAHFLALAKGPVEPTADGEPRRSQPAAPMSWQSRERVAESVRYDLGPRTSRWKTFLFWTLPSLVVFFLAPPGLSSAMFPGAWSDASGLFIAVLSMPVTLAALFLFIASLGFYFGIFEINKIGFVVKGKFGLPLWINRQIQWDDVLSAAVEDQNECTRIVFKLSSRSEAWKTVVYPFDKRQGSDGEWLVALQGVKAPASDVAQALQEFAAVPVSLD